MILVSDPQDLVNLARQIETCDAFIRANVSNRLQVIVNQMNFLRQEAQRILLKARRDDELNHSACNLVRRPGQIYYYYERQSGQKYLSIMHPQDWMTNVKSTGCPHRFLGAYKLEYDNSWTRQATDFDDGLDDPLDELKQQKTNDIKQNRKMIEFLIKSYNFFFLDFFFLSIKFDKLNGYKRYAFFEVNLMYMTKFILILKFIINQGFT